MRFETSVVLFALGAFTSASILEDSQLAHMTAIPSLHPSFMMQDMSFCRRAVDRIRNTSLNEDPNVAIINLSHSSPYTDPGFSQSASMHWKEMPISDQSELLLDDQDKAQFNRISTWLYQDAYDSISMWGSYGIEHIDPIMGGLKDCSLMTAAQTVALKRDRLKKLFLTKSLNDDGVYTVKLYQMGIPVTVTVDDTLPFEHDQGQHKLMYAQASADGALWMPILEKAVAKLYGNYERLLGGSTANAIQTLTAAPYEEFKENVNIKETLLDWMQERQTWGCTLTAASEVSNSESSDASSVIDSFEYIIDSIFLKDGESHVKLIDHRPRCGQNNNGTGEPLVVSYETYKKNYKTTKAYYDVDSYTHNYYAAYNIETPKVKENGTADDNLLYETIKIKGTDVSQFVYISVYTNNAQNFKNTDCWDEKAPMQKRLWAKHDRHDWVEFGQQNYAHLKYVWIEANNDHEVEVAVYWPPEDYTPHDFSVVVWSQSKPVTFEPSKTHIHQDIEKFPLYSLDPDVALYSLSGDLIQGEEHNVPCTGAKCYHESHFGRSDDKYIVDMRVLEGDKIKIRFDVTEEGKNYDMNFLLEFNSDNLVVKNYCKIVPHSEWISFEDEEEWNYSMPWTLCNEKGYWYKFDLEIDSADIDYWYNNQANMDRDSTVMEARFALETEEWSGEESTRFTVYWHADKTIFVRCNKLTANTITWDYNSSINWHLWPTLALKSETTAEAETPKKHANTGVMAGVSVAAASLFACVFLAKAKNVVSDDFERV